MMLVGATLVAGCASGSSAKDVADVDPQVLQDAISNTFMVPGPEVERAMRVNAFVLGMAIVQCGGEPPPLDMTSDRIAQDLFPDLDLIRRQGFGDEVDQRDAALETVGSDCEDLVPTWIRSRRGEVSTMTGLCWPKTRRLVAKR